MFEFGSMNLNAAERNVKPFPDPCVPLLGARVEEVKRGFMVLRVNDQPRIEDLRKHPVGSVDTLSRLLASGATAKRDPRRENFFEVESGSRVYYIHISPVTGKVMLLATWLRDSESVELVSAQQVA